MGGLPCAQVVVDVLQRLRFLLEQRPDLLEPRYRPTGRSATGNPAGHDELSDQFLTAHQPPHPLAIIHEDQLHQMNPAY